MRILARRMTLGLAFFDFLESYISVDFDENFLLALLLVGTLLGFYSAPETNWISKKRSCR